jgi:PAS domain S-box-containing protein
MNEDNELFRGLFESAPDAIVVTNAAGRIKLVNRQTEKLFGYRRDELIGKTVEVLVPSAARRRHVQQREEYENAGPRPMRGHRELTAVNSKGEEIPVEIWLNPLGEGDTRLVVSSIHDVSEKRKLQAQLLQSQKMDLIGQLVGGVAHDFNNLLTVILSFSQFVDEAVRDSGDEQVLQDIGEVMRATDRARSLVAQLLSFSRHQPIESRVVELNEVVDSATRMLRRVLRADIDLVALIPDDPLLCEIDPAKLDQIVMNLTLNARDAMPNGGRLTLELSSVHLDGARVEHTGLASGEFVVLSVSDTGSGMVPAVRDQIFEPFFTTKERGRGTGLGLSVCLAMVQQLGGHILVQTEPDLGTTFKLYFPRVQEPMTVRTVPPVTLPVQGDETILLVEEEPALRASAERSLRKCGFNVLATGHAAEAQSRLKNHEGPIDLLLTEVIMLGMNGNELAKSATALRPGLKVVYMSGYTDETIWDRGSVEDGAQFLQKPFPPAALLRMVRRTLDASTVGAHVLPGV